MGDKISDEVFPEYNTGIADLRASQNAMEIDSRLSTRAIRQPVSSLDNLLQAADELAYQKGQSVLGMFEKWLGPETFRRGVLAYLEAHKNGNAVGADLWNSLSTASGKDVATAMASFLDQGGLPLVTADVLADGRVKLTQKRFLNYGIAAPQEQLWQVPVGLEYSDGTKTRTQYVLLTGPETTVALQGGRAPVWLYPNAGEAGYYRWSLSTRNMLELSEKATDVMTPRERVGFLGNLSALLAAGFTHGDDYLRLLTRFAGDPKPEVVSAVLDGVGIVRQTFITPDLADPYALYVRRTLGPPLQRFGIARRPLEDDGVSLVRPRLIRFLGDQGEDTRILDFADSLARASLKDPASVDPSLGGVAIDLSAIRGDQAMYDDYRHRFETAQVPAERSRYLESLAYFRNPKIVEQSLKYSIEGPLRPQEMFTIPGGLGQAYEYEELPFQWLTENYAAIMSRIPPMFAVYMPRIAGGCSSKRLETAKKFFGEASHAVPGTEKELAKVADQVNDCAGLREREGAAVSTYLNQLGGAK
jgi:alanyl aminopeptidase